MIGERSADLRSVHGPGCVGIEDLPKAQRLAGRINRRRASDSICNRGAENAAGTRDIGKATGCGKIARPVGSRRHRLNAVGSCSALPELLEIEEEEGLVVAVVNFRNGDRSAYRESIIVPSHGVADVLARFIRALRAGIGERQAGVQSFVHEVVVGAAVVLIGARFHGVVDGAAANLAILRGKITGLDTYLLDGIHAATQTVRLYRFPDISGCFLAFDPDGFAIARQPVHYQRVVIGKIHAGKQRYGL